MAKQPGVDPDDLYRQAQETLLRGLVAGDAPQDLVDAVALFHVPGWLTPDVAMLDLAVTALDLACPVGAQPLAHAGLRERLLPEVTFRGRVEQRSSQYAPRRRLHARGAAAGSAQRHWLVAVPAVAYALYAMVIYARAAAERLDVSRGRHRSTDRRSTQH
ncbi:hypothetical protein [Modestobacter altitudinis]|uniref:hypothetical protein n=1 Tax=Modestobacter altitudinis TaxID=2213158 RepID=UPI00110CF2A0|nr:hypothetical protein [Modestobacter altitudinis]